MSDPATDHIDTGTTGAFRQSWRQANPRDVLARIVAAEPDYDEETVKAECWNQFTAGWEFPGAPGADRRLMYAVFSYWFDNNYRSLVGPVRRRQPVQPVPAQQTVEQAQEPQEAQETEEATAEPEAQPTPAQEAATVEARRSALAAAFAARIAARVEARVEEILLNTVMPNGKPLRDNTREELDETIAWQQRIRDRLQPGQTPGEAGLTEEEVRELL